MANQKPPRPHEAPNAGAGDIPAGATRKALNREHMPAEATEDEEPRRQRGAPPAPDDADIEDDATGPTAGSKVGSYGGGATDLDKMPHTGIEPGGAGRGDSTIGADPDEG
jgi:hypothetical protein